MTSQISRPVRIRSQPRRSCFVLWFRSEPLCQRVVPQTRERRMRVRPARICAVFASATLAWGGPHACTAAEPRPQASSGHWSHGPPSTPEYFPIAVWLQDPRQAARYKDAGINLYVALWRGPTESSRAQEARPRSSRCTLIHSGAGWKSSGSDAQATELRSKALTPSWGAHEFLWRAGLASRSVRRIPRNFTGFGPSATG